MPLNPTPKIKGLVRATGLLKPKVSKTAPTPKTEAITPNNHGIGFSLSRPCRSQITVGTKEINITIWRIRLAMRAFSVIFQITIIGIATARENL